MWKIKQTRSYDELGFSIKENELEKAICAFLTGNPVVFNAGAAVRHIDSIVPDYHAVMGWNEGHKLSVDDHAELNKYDIPHKLRNAYEEKTRKVKYLVSSKQEHLIGKNVELPKLGEENPISEEVKRLAEAKRM
mgnify:FL=1